MVEQYGAESLFQVRRQHIAQVLEAMGGNMDATANVLGITPSELGRFMAPSETEKTKKC